MSLRSGSTRWTEISRIGWGAGRRWPLTWRSPAMARSGPVRTAEAPRLDRAGSRRSRFGVVDAAWRRANTWMFTPGDARRLAAVRIGLCALLAARIGRGIYRDLASQPPALFRPVSFMRLLGGMPGRGVVIGLQAAG